MLKHKIVKWIRNEVKKARAYGIVMGLSGGLDSSVVAALCKEAVGRDNLMAIIMPCHSQKEDLEDAGFILRHLKLKKKIVDLSSVYNHLLALLPGKKRLAAANLKSRLRMSVLYYFANTYNYLVCGTGNKSEIMTGYFTKYGDGAADILPIGGLLKKQVKELAFSLNIPIRIIQKVPSAGLWPGQSDEKEMGVSYEELDAVLGGSSGVCKSKVNKVKGMLRRSEHKREGARIFYFKEE